MILFCSVCVSLGNVANFFSYFWNWKRDSIKYYGYKYRRTVSDLRSPTNWIDECQKRLQHTNDGQVMLIECIHWTGNWKFNAIDVWTKIGIIYLDRFIVISLQSLLQVSWVRHRDIHLLTVGRYTYTSDQRFRAIHHPHSEDWILQIKYPQHRDSGIYECQVSYKLQPLD